MEKEQFFDLASKTIEYSKNKNVKEIELYFQYDKTIDIMAEKQSISTERQKEEAGITVRILKEGSEGYSYTNKMNLKSLQHCTDEALAIASSSPPKQGLKLAKSKKYSIVSGIYSKSVSDLSIEDMIEDMEVILKEITSSQTSISLNLSSLSTNERWVGLVNSNEIEAFEKYNNYSGGLLAAAKNEEKVGGFVVENFFTRDPKSIDMVKFSNNLIQKAIQNLNSIALKGISSDTVIYKGSSNFSLAFVLNNSINADNIQQNRSMWKDKLLDEVAIEEFTYIDDSHNNERGAGVRSFDDEGNPTQKTEIIKDGILETFLYDELRALRADTISTGNAAKSGTKFMSPLNTITPNAPIISSGELSEEELIEGVKEGIIFDRFSGSTNPINGYFSGVAKGALLIKNGEISSPLTNVTIGGNIFDVLKNIDGIGKDTSLVYGYLTAPLIKAKGVSIKTE
ncbi:MAG: TldD/PmbA family protein [Candidatus Heimdallarchaeota archaeon]|nr:TldD/PmbA family protein [Candidatus Heimdallarchaeota archaeon]